MLRLNKTFTAKHRRSRLHAASLRRGGTCSYRLVAVLRVG
jgi:hypothetical protein